jgi:hypothetical protein
MTLTLGKAPLAECHTRQSDQYRPFLLVFPILSKQTKDTSQSTHEIIEFQCGSLRFVHIVRHSFFETFSNVYHSLDI